MGVPLLLMNSVFDLFILLVAYPEYVFRYLKQTPGLFGIVLACIAVLSFAMYAGYLRWVRLWNTAFKRYKIFISVFSLIGSFFVCIAVVSLIRADFGVKVQLDDWQFRGLGNWKVQQQLMAEVYERIRETGLEDIGKISDPNALEDGERWEITHSNQEIQMLAIGVFVRGYLDAFAEENPILLRRFSLSELEDGIGGEVQIYTNNFSVSVCDMEEVRSIIDAKIAEMAYANIHRTMVFLSIIFILTGIVVTLMSMGLLAFVAYKDIKVYVFSGARLQF